VLAEALADHRLAYLNYEGPVSGNRGRVVRWDTGEFDWRQDETDQVIVDLHGGRIQGQLLLERANKLAGPYSAAESGLDTFFARVTG
jgi:hypothetical protein